MIFARNIIGVDVTTGKIKWEKPVPGGLSNLYVI
ncbi:MAG: PQQ-binding-like beta-propeller repeat protein [Lewinellaceae bacterium]|nr:PQQ-binding-like beta-propeller repeat protein [Lewinellaceae bacterium]